MTDTEFVQVKDHHHYRDCRIVTPPSEGIHIKVCSCWEHPPSCPACRDPESGGEQARHDWWARLCADPKMCNANAYFYVMEGTGSPEIDWMCRKDLADNGHCWCGKLQGGHKP